GEFPGLLRWDDRVVRALQEQHGNVDLRDPVDRGALLVGGAVTGEDTDEGVEVAGFEVVGFLHEPKQVGDAVVGDAAGEHVLGECEQSGEPSCASPADRQPVGVGEALVDEALGCGDDVFHVDDPPLVVEAFPVGAAVPGGSAVVDVDDADPAAGEVGLVQVEPGGGSSGGAAVHPDDVGGGPFPFHFGVGGRVDVGVHGGAVAAGQG